jgi:phosphatidylglycerophosphatase A
MGILIASIIVFVIGVIACGAHVRRTGREDPPECVIDELAGQWLACSACMLPFGRMAPVMYISLPAFALAFAAFRLFDIWKPWPVGWADEKITGGLGVMADDMIAGAMAGAVVVAARYFLPI